MYSSMSKMMQQLNELKIHRWLQNAFTGEAAMSDETIKGVVGDISTALSKQFQESRTGEVPLAHVQRRASVLSTMVSEEQARGGRER